VMRSLISIASVIALAGCATSAQTLQPMPIPASSAPLESRAAPAGFGGPAERAISEAIERVVRIDPQLHSVIALDPTAIAQAQRIDTARIPGALAGQPVLIKDNIESVGPLPTTAGSLALAGNVTNRDAP